MLENKGPASDAWTAPLSALLGLLILQKSCALLPPKFYGHYNHWPVCPMLAITGKKLPPMYWKRCVITLGEGFWFNFDSIPTWDSQGHVCIIFMIFLCKKRTPATYLGGILLPLFYVWRGIIKTNPWGFRSWVASFIHTKSKWGLFSTAEILTHKSCRKILSSRKWLWLQICASARVNRGNIFRKVCIALSSDTLHELGH